MSQLLRTLSRGQTSTSGLVAVVALAACYVLARLLTSKRGKGTSSGKTSRTASNGGASEQPSKSAADLDNNEAYMLKLTEAANGNGGSNSSSNSNSSSGGNTKVFGSNVRRPVPLLQQQPVYTAPFWGESHSILLFIGGTTAQGSARVGGDRAAQHAAAHRV